MANSSLLDILRIKDLRNRIFYTLGILMVFRIGTVLPIPGVDLTVIREFFLSNQQSSGVSIESFLDFFSGGAYGNFSIFLLGIMPYITTSIIMNLVVMVVPALRRISEEDGGKKKIQRITRYVTAVVCIVQAIPQVTNVSSIAGAVTIDGTAFFILAIVTVMTGTLFLMWLGEQINARGIGNGISLIIFAGIVARMPNAIWQLIEGIQNRQINQIFVLIATIMFVSVIALVIYEQRGQRKIMVHYAKRVVGRKMYGAQNTYIPFKLNPSGVIPVIFASSVLTFLIQGSEWVAQLTNTPNAFGNFLDPLKAPYLVINTLLIVFFAYFYTQIQLNPIEISKQIRENGGSIPGIRTEKMEEYMTRVLNRIILPGSLFLALIAIIPTLVQIAFQLPIQIAYLMGGTSLLILVGVDLDLMAQIEGQLRMHHHDGLTKKGRIKSRNL
jgi:preprotein translocase subunit SecY